MTGKERELMNLMLEDMNAVLYAMLKKAPPHRRWDMRNFSLLAITALGGYLEAESRKWKFWIILPKNHSAEDATEKFAEFFDSLLLIRCAWAKREDRDFTLSYRDVYAASSRVQTDGEDNFHGLGTSQLIELARAAILFSEAPVWEDTAGVIYLAYMYAKRLGINFEKVFEAHDTVVKNRMLDNLVDYF